MKRANISKENKELKHGNHLKNDSESLFEKPDSQIEPGNMNLYTPFSPRTEEHAELLKKARTGEQTAKLLLHLQRSYGNGYVQRLVRDSNLTTINSSEVQRQEFPEEEEELQMKASRVQRQEDEEVIPGARRQSGSRRSGSSIQRAAPSSSATGNIGDATDLDGQGLYGWNRVTYDTDVATVVNGVIPTESSEEEMPRIVIFSGTHGTDPGGHLLNDEDSREFVNEDRATANAVMAANPGVQVEVIDVVNSYRSKGELTSVYGMTDYIRILGWCFSQRSYGLGSSIKSNWWPEPDNL